MAKKNNKKNQSQNRKKNGQAIADSRKTTAQELEEKADELKETARELEEKADELKENAEETVEEVKAAVSGNTEELLKLEKKGKKNRLAKALRYFVLRICLLISRLVSH